MYGILSWKSTSDFIWSNKDVVIMTIFYVYSLSLTLTLTPPTSNSLSLLCIDVCVRTRTRERSCLYNWNPPPTPTLPETQRKTVRSNLLQMAFLFDISLFNNSIYKAYTHLLLYSEVPTSSCKILEFFLISSLTF